MKYLISAVIVLGLFISQTANAQIRDFINNRVNEIKPGVFSEDRHENMEERREYFQNKLEERRENIEQRIENRKENLTEKRSERSKDILDKILKRFSAAIERLEKLSERIQERINIFKERGIDVEESQNLLDEAQRLINESKSALDDAVTESEELISGEFSKEDFREIINGTKNSIKKSHEALVKSIKSLRANYEIVESDNELKYEDQYDNSKENQ